MKYLVIVCCLLSIVSCKKSNGPTPSTPPLIYGVQMTDANANPLQIMGLPNIRLTHNQYTMWVYPNPASNFCTLDMFSTDDSAQVTFVLVAGTYMDTLPTYLTLQSGFTLHSPIVDNEQLWERQAPLYTYTAAVGKHVTAELGVMFYTDATLPNGFYKMTAYLSSATAKDTLWANIWLNR